MALIDPTTPAGVQPNYPGASGHTLLFSEEFNGNGLDPKWRAFRDYSNSTVPTNFDLNAGGNSMCRMWYDSSQSGPNNRVHLDTKGSEPFSSFYAIYECRVKMMRGRGAFPAFWVVDKDLTSNPIKPEIDFFECYGYDGGGWTLGSSDGWRPRNAAYTRWYDGAGNPGPKVSLKLTDSNACEPAFCSSGLTDCADLSAGFHIFTAIVSETGMQSYFDGVAWGCEVPNPWTPAEVAANPMAVTIDLSWDEAGLPSPNATDTPSGAANGMQWDYIRVWTVSTTGGGGGGATLSAAVTLAPGDSASGGVDTGLQTSAQLLSDMTVAHEAFAHGVNPAWAWGSGPVLTNGVNCPPDYPDPHFVPWGVAASDAAGSPATNVRVQIRKLNYDVKRNGVWSRIAENASIIGALYTNYETNTTAPANTRNHGADGISVKLPVGGGSFHFYTSNRYRTAFGPQEIVTSLEAQLIVDDSTLPDDRSTAKLLVNCAGDWWRSATQTWNGTNSNTEFAIGRFTYVTNTWKPFSAHTLTTSTERDDYISEPVISGTVRFEVAGTAMVNVELVPGTGTTPKYGTFTVASDGTSAYLDLNTTALTNGTYTMRILAYDVPAGQSGNVVTAMETRTYTIENLSSGGGEPGSPTSSRKVGGKIGKGLRRGYGF